MNLNEDLKAEALALGFSFLHITDCSQPSSFPIFTDWLARGHHAGMAYLAGERSQAMRREPPRLVNGCRSILVAGLPYPMLPLEPPAGAQGVTGRIAAYACARDYHSVIPALMRELSQVFARSGLPTDGLRFFTDSAPILERDLAQRAGAGWIGKSTCLIRPGEGSYHLLGEAFSAIEMEPDPPFPADHCGTCQRCIQACPTGCILPNRTIDANRCISYLTIENRGGIPVELRPLIGDHVFGCDICQQVCPWNRFASLAVADSPLGLQPDMAFPDLVSQVRLGLEEFQATYGDSPVSRAKYRGYLRNVVVALGNSRDPAAIPHLAIVLENNPDAMLRGHAAWALGTIGTRAARARLESWLGAETDEDVCGEMRLALNHGRG